MEKLQEKAVQAAGRFLERRGYDVLESNPGGEGADIVARDGSTLVFVDVSCREGASRGLPKAGASGSRERMEAAALAWLAALGDDGPADVAVRFDHIAMAVMSPERAFIRHHIDAWGPAESCEAR